MANNDQVDKAGRQLEAYCQHCGHLIAKQPYNFAGDAYCSESCFLKTRDTCARQDDMFNLLAETLVGALDLREHETGLHSKRVACHTLVLARRFSVDPNTLQQIYWGALLHDIGKIGISDAILLKSDSLTESEWTEMRTHPEKGYHLISQIPGMTDAADIILCHEERYNGSGYPKGLSGSQIPLGARLFMVIDTLDAITSDRPYRKANSFDVAKAEILHMAGSQFDPKVVDTFDAEEEVLREMVMLKCHWPLSFSNKHNK
ncbi:HD-GYP domain-containing protein [Nitrosomonas ureae]|jgi:HD-GYP domain-containing protein (c-di-GMP phosphodiesterase class II)|uniref:HD domain-containing protein n=1 Tax=Nitrosomonas ureae TaxID=44577 RepID=A0A286ALR2_9PROT|nr:HD domain-containing phosphohydrolase [Nitrosomonas ureae]SOD22824.1 HD domain-containing protein [Nitrosomonas ureae]